MAHFPMPALPRLALSALVLLGLAACGSSEPDDPVQAYLDSAEIASAVSVEPAKPLPQSVPIVRSRPLLQSASPSTGSLNTHKLEQSELLEAAFADLQVTV